jgi:hypothetical protein
MAEEIDYDKLAKALKRAGVTGGGGSSTTPSTPSNPNASKLEAALGKGAEKVTQFGEKLVNASGDLLESWQNISKSGASFSTDILGMGVSAAGARLNLREFGDVISSNSKTLTGLGGNVTRGAEAFSKLSKQMFDSGAANTLRDVGYTAKDLNDVLAMQVGFEKSNFKDTEEGRRKSIQSAKDLAMEMDSMAKLTGKSREAQMEDLKKSQADGAVIAKMRILSAGKSEDEIRKMKDEYTKGLLQAQQNGTEQMYKEFFATGTYMTKQAGTQSALLGEQSRAMEEQVKAIQGGDSAKAAEQRAKVDAANMKNQGDKTLNTLATFASGGSMVADIAKKNVEAGDSMYEGVKKVAEANGILLKTQQDYAAALKLALQDIKAAQSGQRKDVDAKTGKPTGDYKNVGGAGQAMVTAQTAKQDLESAAKAAALAATKEQANKSGGDVAREYRKVNPVVEAEKSAIKGIDYKPGTPEEEKKKSAGQKMDESGGGYGAAARAFGDLVNPTIKAAGNVVIEGIDIGKKAGGGFVDKPQVNLIGEAGPEWVLNKEQMKDTLANAARDGAEQVSSLIPKADKAPSIDVGAISKQVNTSISSAGGKPASSPVPTMVEQSMSMGKMMLKDDQKKIFDDMMSMNDKQAKEKLASLKAEEAAARAANKAAYTARDAIEEKYEAEGKSIKDITGEDKVRFDELTKQMNASGAATTKAQSAIKAAERAEQTRQSLQKMGYEVGLKQEEEKAKIVEETGEKIKNDIKEALPVKEIEDSSAKTKTALTEQQEITLKYAYQDEEGKKMQLDNQKNLIKGELNSIAEKNKQIEDIQKEADGRELTNREKNRIEKLQKEVEAGKETLKLRQDDLEVYQNLDKLSAERGLKEKQEAAKKEAQIKDQAMLDQLKAEVANGKQEEELTVNGKKVDPNSDEGKAAMAQMEKAKADMQSTVGGMIKEMPKAMAESSLKVNGKEVDPNSDEGKAAIAQLESAKADMAKLLGSAGPTGGAPIVEDKVEGKQIPNISAEPKEAGTVKGVPKIDMNSIRMPFNTPGLKAGQSQIEFETQKKEQAKKAEEAKIAETKKKEEEAKKKDEAAGKPGAPAAGGGKAATLDDVVKSLTQLNKQMGQLLSQHEELGKKQIGATKANSGNAYAR